MGKKRAYSAKPSITSGDRCRASLPGLALLLGMGAGGGPWGLQATGLMPAALGLKPHKPSGQIPCQQTIKFGATDFRPFETREKSVRTGQTAGPCILAARVQTVIKLQFEKRKSHHD